MQGLHPTRPACAIGLAAVIAMISLGRGASARVSNDLSGRSDIQRLVRDLPFVFSAAVGVTFGFFPARKAAKLDPIDALRNE